jgi:hypothetical protein
MALGLIGDWIVAGAARYHLAADGTCYVSPSEGGPVASGTWRSDSVDSFEIALGDPDRPGDGRVTHYQILNNQPDRLLVEGREGGPQGVVHDPVEWVLAQAIY